MRPIYEPKGAAGEYAEYALNIYTGCTNGCAYCYAPGILRKTREEFARDVHVREGLMDALGKQLASGAYAGRTIHLCFTCDPYPTRVDTAPTRMVIRMLKDAGCHVQVLTKNPGDSQRDWDLLDGEDRLGTTFTGDDLRCEREPYSEAPSDRLCWLEEAKGRGLRTWLSCEPVLEPAAVLSVIARSGFIDEFKIGKLNHGASDIDWREFGREVEIICQRFGRDYAIKDSLRRAMDASGSR